MTETETNLAKSENLPGNFKKLKNSYIKFLRLKRKFPEFEKNNKNTCFDDFAKKIKKKKIVGVKIPIKTRDDINFKKKNINYKKLPGFDLLQNLLTIHSYEELIRAIFDHLPGKNYFNNKLQNTLAGIIEIYGYARTTSMLLQLQKESKNIKKDENDKIENINNIDNISISSGESIKDMKLYEPDSDSEDYNSEIIFIKNHIKNKIKNKNEVNNSFNNKTNSANNNIKNITNEDAMSSTSLTSDKVNSIKLKNLPCEILEYPNKSNQKNKDKKNENLYYTSLDIQDNKYCGRNKSYFKELGLGAHLYKDIYGFIYKYALHHFKGQDTAVFHCNDKNCIGIANYNVDTKDFSIIIKCNLTHMSHSYIKSPSPKESRLFEEFEKRVVNNGQIMRKQKQKYIMWY